MKLIAHNNRNPYEKLSVSVIVYKHHRINWGILAPL